MTPDAGSTQVHERPAVEKFTLAIETERGGTPEFDVERIEGSTYEAARPHRGFAIIGLPLRPPPRM